MIDNGEQTLEQCLDLCDQTLRRFGVQTLVGEERGVLYGRAFLDIFDSDLQVIRPYQRKRGNAEFRSFCRSLGMDHVKSVTALLTALYDLLPQIREQFDRPDFAPPEPSESYVRRLLLDDITAWPDDLFAGFKYSFAELERGLDSYFVGADFNDLSITWRAEVTPALAVRNAVDLACLGPWMGIPVPKVTEALKNLATSLHKRQKTIVPPLQQCLERGEAWQLKFPLMCDGLQGDMIVSIGGGALSGLSGNRSGLVRELSLIADVMASALAKARFRKAWNIIKRLRSWETEQGIYLGLAQAIDHLVAPHKLHTLNVNDEIRIGMQRGHETPPVRRSANISECEIVIGSQKFSAEIEFCTLSNILNDNLEHLSIHDRLHHLISHFVAEVQGASIPSHQSHAVVSQGDPYVAAKDVLSRHRNSTVSRREFFACFVALALLSHPDETRFEISAAMIRALQERLPEEEGVVRQRAAKSGGENEDLLSISQLAPTAQDLRDAELLIGNIKLERPRGKLRVEVISPFAPGKRPGASQMGAAVAGSI